MDTCSEDELDFGAVPQSLVPIALASKKARESLVTPEPNVAANICPPTAPNKTRSRPSPSSTPPDTAPARRRLRAAKPRAETDSDDDEDEKIKKPVKGRAAKPKFAPLARPDLDLFSHKELAAIMSELPSGNVSSLDSDDSIKECFRALDAAIARPLENVKTKKRPTRVRSRKAQAAVLIAEPELDASIIDEEEAMDTLGGLDDKQHKSMQFYSGFSVLSNKMHAEHKKKITARKREEGREKREQKEREKEQKRRADNIELAADAEEEKPSVTDVLMEVDGVMGSMQLGSDCDDDDERMWDDATRDGGMLNV